MFESPRSRAPGRSSSRLAAALLAFVCLGIVGFAANGVADLPLDRSNACLSEGCLESEAAYVAHLESSEPELPWDRVRSVGFEDGQVVVQLSDSRSPSDKLVASLAADAE